MGMAEVLKEFGIEVVVWRFHFADHNRAQWERFSNLG
jgi:hypothetical protein